jgi:hypothetical protein
MARQRQHIKGIFMPVHAGSFHDRLIDAGNAGRAVYLGLWPALQQFGQPAAMIGVMVGDQDSLQASPR